MLKPLREQAENKDINVLMKTGVLPLGLIMSQAQILKLISDNPGIAQKELKKYNQSSGVQIRALLRKGLIHRKQVLIPTGQKNYVGVTYKLYLIKESTKNQDNRKFCDLRTQDPDFNEGSAKGRDFIKAMDRAIARGDFK